MRTTFVLLTVALVSACSGPPPSQSCLTSAECGADLCVDGTCQAALPGRDAGGDAAAEDAATVDVESVDAGPSDDAASTDVLVLPDTGPPPSYVRSESRDNIERSGNPVSIGPYVAWMRQDGSARLSWYHRAEEQDERTVLGGIYTLRSTAVVSAGNVWVAWERTGAGALPEGVLLTNFGSAPSGLRPARTEVPGALGFPRLIIAATGMLRTSPILVAETSTDHAIAAFMLSGSEVTRSEDLPGAELRGATAVPGGFAYATATEVRVVNTMDWTVGDPITVSGEIRGLTMLAGRLIVGLSAGAEGSIMSFSMGGTRLAEYALPISGEAYPRVLSDGTVVLVSPGESEDGFLLDQNLDVVQEVELLRGEPHLGLTARGFVVLSENENLLYIEHD